MMRYSKACHIFGSDKMVVAELGIGSDVRHCGREGARVLVARAFAIWD